MDAIIGERLTVELDDGRVVEGRYLASAPSTPTPESEILERLFGDMTEFEVKQVEAAVRQLAEDFEHMERTLRETNAYLRGRGERAS